MSEPSHLLRALPEPAPRRGGEARSWAPMGHNGRADDSLDLPAVAAVLDDDAAPPAPAAARTPPGSDALGEAVDALTARALQGDKAAWSALIRMHNAAVVGLIMSYRVPRQRAEELAQEAWLKLYLKVSAGVITVLKLPGLILREAGWRALDEVRRADHVHPSLDAPLRAEDEDSGGRLRDLLAHEGPSPEDQAAAREELLQLRRIFLALPDRQRQVAWLAVARGLTHAEIVEALADRGVEISPLTSKFTLSKARKRMRAIRDLPSTPERPMREAYLLRHADGRQLGGIALELGLSRPALDALLQDAFQRIKSAGGC